MAEHPGPEDRFGEALQAMIEQITDDCRYRPEQYIQTVIELGGVRAAKQLVAGPLSDDSVQLWARGRPDLMIEAIVLNDDWKSLFSEEERSVAEQRQADMASPVAAIPPQLSDHLSDYGQDLGNPWGTILFPEDDIVWGEELSEGIAVCEKLEQVEKLLHDDLSGPSLAYFRKHLAACPHCATERSSLKQALKEFDSTKLQTISDLLAQCDISLNCNEHRARELLSAEWKEAGYPFLPSEAEAAGIADYGWKDPSMSEGDQVLDWMRLLNVRAGLLCARTGTTVRDYEETQITEFPSEEDSEEFRRNPWRVWRLGIQHSQVCDFVQRLTNREFLIVLMARNLAQIGVKSTGRVLTVPSDGDLDSLEGILTARMELDRHVWKSILSEHFIIRTLHITNLDVTAGTAKSHKTSRHSDLENLDWQQLLYLAWCGALEQAAVEESGPRYSVEKAVIDLKESLSAYQMPVIDLLERLVEQTRDNQGKPAAEESLRTALGSRVYDSLTPASLTSALGAEQILQDPHFAAPSHGVAALGLAFELELKNGFLGQFCKFLNQRTIRWFPDNEWLDENRRRPQILIRGRQNDRLTLGDIARSLESPRSEIPEFCATYDIDLIRLRKAIDIVKRYRNQAAHHPSIPFVTARQIREELLGVVSGNGGVFGALVCQNSGKKPTRMTEDETGHNGV